MAIKANWHQSKNFGDTLTPIIVKHFTGQDVEYAERKARGKLIAVGSIIVALRSRDVVWGTGSIRAGGKGCIKQPVGSKFLAVRGPLTRQLIDGEVPEVYGDPGILLPLIYNPKIEKTHKVGIMPHRVDKPLFKEANGLYKSFVPGTKLIDIDSGWQNVINEILSCEVVLTSSLHGIVAANAYGVPVVWEKYSDNVIGGEFKFQDYFAGVGIPPQKYGNTIPGIENLKEKQIGLIEALQNYYCECN